MYTQGSFFVTRAKDNMRFHRMYSKPVDKEQGVRYDQIGKLETYYPKKEYPDKRHWIKYYDWDTDKELIFLTNNNSLTALNSFGEPLLSMLINSGFPLFYIAFIKND